MLLHRHSYALQLLSFIGQLRGVSRHVYELPWQHPASMLACIGQEARYLLRSNMGSSNRCKRLLTSLDWSLYCIYVEEPLRALPWGKMQCCR